MSCCLLGSGANDTIFAGLGDKRPYTGSDFSSWRIGFTETDGSIPICDASNICVERTNESYDSLYGAVSLTLSDDGAYECDLAQVTGSGNLNIVGYSITSILV